MWEVTRFALSWLIVFTLVEALVGYYRAKQELRDEKGAAIVKNTQLKAMVNRADVQHHYIVINGDYVRGTYGDYLPPMEARVIQRDGTLRWNDIDIKSH